VSIYAGVIRLGGARRTKETLMITCYAFGWVPPFARGLVRDLRVRWALEEAGIPYRVTLVGDGPGQMSRDAYRAIQPFGQIPAIEDGDFRLFESGAIVQFVAERSGGALLPESEAGRARVAQWLFAALNTIEMPVQELAAIDLFYTDDAWAKERRAGAVEAVRERLGQLAACLAGREYLVERFTAADLMMTTVLRILRHTDLALEHRAVAEYQQRCEARPAFAKALAGQLEPFGE
jgi:glutathione S-transferase